MSEAQRVDVRDDLSIAIGGAIAVVSPREAFQLAERLIRTAARRALAEEAEHGALEDGAHRERAQ